MGTISVVAIAVAEITWTALTLVLSRRRGGSREVSPMSIRSLATQGLPIAVVSVTVLTNNKIDVPLLSRFRPGAEVAAYWGAYNLLFAAMATASTGVSSRRVSGTVPETGAMGTWPRVSNCSRR